MYELIVFYAKPRSNNSNLVRALNQRAGLYSAKRLCNYCWFISKLIMNRLKHALNGNMTSESSSRSEYEAGESRFDQFEDKEDFDIDFEEMEDLLEDFIEGNVDLDTFDLQVKTEPNEDFDEPSLVFATPDVLDILGGFEPLEKGRDLIFPIHPPCDIPPGEREYRPIPTCPSRIVGEVFTIYSSQEDVFISDMISTIKVGRIKPWSKLRITKKVEDFFLMSSLYSEHTQTKGTCLGYSSLVHLTACLMVATKDSIMEPSEGHDLYLKDQDVMIEMTGANWQTRKSSATCVLGKYMLLTFLNLSDEDNEIIRLSKCEDQYDSSGFLNSKFDQERSPYSDTIDALHQVTRCLTTSAMKGFGDQFKHWLSLQKPLLDDEKRPWTKRDIYSKVYPYLKKMKQHSPFRVEQRFDNLVDEMYEIDPRPYLINESIGTTFHTMFEDFDPIPSLLESIENNIPMPMNTNYIFNTWLFSEMMKYRLFNSVYVESELASKVRGNQGRYFSMYSRVGICWQRTKAGSNIYYIAYYAMTPPKDLLSGIWIAVENYWLSPTIKTSVLDLQYSTLLPWRFMNQVNSMLAYSSNDRSYILKGLLLVLGLTRWSSWQSTSICGDSRFLFLCIVSGTGDIDGMIDKIISRLKPNINFPDCLFVRMIHNMVNSNLNKELTPFLQLPMRFLSIEKDLPLLQMWHIRGAHHATNCYLKLCQGLLDEENFRNDRILVLKKSLEYLTNAITDGVTQSEFNNFMDSLPKNCAIYNHVLMIAFAYKSAQLLDAGKRQAPTKTCLTNLVSDHHSTDFDVFEDGMLIKSSRVADGLSKTMREYKNPEGIHKLIVRMANGERKITNVYAIHPKDSKSKDREIPQMSRHMRAIQFVSESLISVYTDAESVDMMQDPEKYNKFINNFMLIMKNKGMARSEDKKFFAGNMQPESMSLCTLVVAIATQSTSLVTSAAIQRCNRCRWTISPAGCDTSIIPKQFQSARVILQSGNVRQMCVASKNYYHMQQGVYAMGGALVNTVFTSGLDLFQKELLTDIEYTAVMTTSDDSARGVYIKKEPIFDPEQVMSEYINRGVVMAQQFMMLDSSDKPIRSNRLAEFNNVATGPNGMFPQQFVHGHLIMQPLVGLTIIDDIITVISNARMSITWGDSIDVARSALIGYIMLLSQKWFLTHEQIDYLTEVGILPARDENLIAGFEVTDEKILTKIYKRIPDDLKDDVLAGNINPMRALRDFNLKQNYNKHMPLVELQGLPLPMVRSMLMINASRKLRGRQHERFYRLPPVEDRKLMRDKFISFISSEVIVDPVAVEALKPLLSQRKIMITPTRTRAKDFRPSPMGNVAQTDLSYNISTIEANRFFQINATEIPADHEREKINLPPVEYERWLSQYKMKKDVEGFKFSSPSGRPQMKIWNNKLFARPMSFSFQVDVRESVFTPKGFQLKGVLYKDFKPTWWSDYDLQNAAANNARLAFGMAKLGNDFFAFFASSRDRVITRMSFTYAGKNDFVIITDRNNIRWYIPKRQSTDVLTTYRWLEYKPTLDFISNLTGDHNAVMNYGNFFNSSSLRAHAIMSQIFKKYQSHLPSKLAQLKPKAPFFHAKISVEIERGCTTVLIGSRSVTKLKLVHTDHPELLVRINCEGDIPVVIKKTEQVVTETTGGWSDDD